MRTAPLALAFALTAASTFAAPPQLSHGRIEPLGGGGSLRARVESVAGTAWVGWSIPTRDGSRVSCCDGWSNGCTSCRLDGDNINVRRDDDDLRQAIDHHNLF